MTQSVKSLAVRTGIVLAVVAATAGAACFAPRVAFGWLEDVRGLVALALVFLLLAIVERIEARIHARH